MVTVREREEEGTHKQVPHIWGSVSFIPSPLVVGEERVIRWSRAGQEEEDVVTADLSPEVTLSNSQLLLGWKAESFLKGTMF